MSNFLSFAELSVAQITQYRKAITDGFPNILSDSEGMREYWLRLEKCSPRTQLFLIGADDNVIGFMNTIPVYWDRPLSELPDDGWDWLAEKGIDDYNNNIKTNCLGGLQIIVTKENLGKGYSKVLIAEAKRMVEKMGFEHFFIPIRPTFKHRHPEMAMEEYIKLKQDDKIYDPWIRTHLNSGARIIKICKNAMNITGDVAYWEDLIGHKIESSGNHIVPGALNPVEIDIDKNYGEYREPNIWISYS